MKKLALLLTVATFAITSCNETKPAEEAVEATAEVATDAAAPVVDTAAAAATAVVDSAAAAVAPATK